MKKILSYACPIVIVAFGCFVIDWNLNAAVALATGLNAGLFIMKLLNDIATRLDEDND